MLVITKSPGSNTLQFKHLEDPDPIPHPAHTGVASATVITEFVCPSPTMAIVFDVAPVADYHITVIPITSPAY